MPTKKKQKTVESPTPEEKALIKKAWRIFGIALLATCIAEYWVHPHDYFPGQSWRWFHVLYGFVGCVAIVYASILIGKLLKKPEDYYDD